MWALLAQKELVGIWQERKILGDLGLLQILYICNLILLPLIIQWLVGLVYSFTFPCLILQKQKEVPQKLWTMHKNRESILNVEQPEARIRFWMSRLPVTIHEAFKCFLWHIVILTSIQFITLFGTSSIYENRKFLKKVLESSKCFDLLRICIWIKTIQSK